MAISFSEIATMASSDVITTFKRVYLKAVDAIPDMTALSRQLQRTTKFRAGPDGLHFNVKLESGYKVANVPDGKLLPTPAAPVRQAGSANPVHTYRTIAVGGQSIALTSEPRQAFVRNLADQMEDAMQTVSFDVERQLNGDGVGVLGLIETVASAPTYDIQSPYGLSGAGPGTMLLVEGMEVAALNPSGGAERDRQVITSIDTALEQFTTGSSISGAVIGDLLVLCNDVDATGTDAVTNHNSEASGLLAGIASGDTFEGINGATHRRWNATVIASSGAVSERKIATLEARVKAFGGEKPDLFYTTRGISIELQDQLAGLRRFSGESQVMKGGFEGVVIAGRRIIEGDWCPKGHFFSISTNAKAIGTIDLVKKGFIDLDGAELHRIEGRHAYRADLWFPHNLLWFSRSAHGVLTDLDDDNSIIR